MGERERSGRTDRDAGAAAGAGGVVDDGSGTSADLKTESNGTGFASILTGPTRDIIQRQALWRDRRFPGPVTEVLLGQCAGRAGARAFTAECAGANREIQQDGAAIVGSDDRDRAGFGAFATAGTGVLETACHRARWANDVSSSDITAKKVPSVGSGWHACYLA